MKNGFEKLIILSIIANVFGGKCLKFSRYTSFTETFFI
jgi:hypothetical protein